MKTEGDEYTCPRNVITDKSEKSNKRILNTDRTTEHNEILTPKFQEYPMKTVSYVTSTAKRVIHV